MQFILTAGWDDGVADLTERLVRELDAGRKTLWLVTGGSNIKASVKIMDTIPTEMSRNLTVLLADERYGEEGHADSNWAQLIEAGFDGKQAKLLPILREGKSFEDTIEYYQSLCEEAFSENDTVISQMGIGTDGHIAGILPGSAAANETEHFVIGYKSSPFERLTMTFPALKEITADYSFAFGQPKRDALQMLRDKTNNISHIPAEILKELPEAYIYNDQVGDN